MAGCDSFVKLGRYPTFCFLLLISRSWFYYSSMHTVSFIFSVLPYLLSFLSFGLLNYDVQMNSIFDRFFWLGKKEVFFFFEKNLILFIIPFFSSSFITTSMID